MGVLSMCIWNNEANITRFVKRFKEIFYNLKNLPIFVAFWPQLLINEGFVRKFGGAPHHRRFVRLLPFHSVLEHPGNALPGFYGWTKKPLTGGHKGLPWLDMISSSATIRWA